MKIMKSLGLVAGLLVGVVVANPAMAAKCGNTGAGYGAWVQEFKREAASNGIRPSVLDAVFASTYYNLPTISTDRG